MVTALVWGLTPRLTESVGWIAGRTDVLACVFGLAAMAVSSDLAPAKGPSLLRWSRALLSAALLFGALASKEVSVAFVAAFVASAVRRPNGETSDARRERLLRLTTTVVVATLPYFVLRAVALRGGTPEPRSMGILERLATTLEAAARYAEMLVDPLRPSTCIGTMGQVDGVRAAIGAAVVVGCSFMVVRSWRRLPAGTIPTLTLASVALGLVLHLVPIPLAGSVAADRLLYVPLAGAAISSALVLSSAPLRPRPAALLASLAFVTAIAFASATKRRLSAYADEARFWTVAAEDAPRNNPVPLLALAGVVRDAGEAELACRVYERARAIPPDVWTRSAHRRARENLVTCWATIGRYRDALSLAEVLAREYPRMGRVKMLLAFAQLHTRDFDGAGRSFAEALELDPALSPFITPATVDLAIARAEAPAFDAREIPSEQRVAYAQHLARIGRLPEAESAHLAIAEDPAASHDARRQALKFLVAHGRLVLARRALSANRWLSESEFTEAERALRVREERRARVSRLIDRIDALADG
ncbi:MAG: tetratricopeptide repeat protein [Labilithrix sp.]|nr:tetratricopeptide repeat protein [Labilithrix sp.]